MTVRVSWSSIRTHEECKQRSHLARAKHLAILDNKRGYFPGSVSDRVVRNWLMDDPESHLGEMPDMVTSVMDLVKTEWKDEDQGVVRWKDSEDRAKVEAECREAVELVEPYLLKYVVPYEYQADYAFEAPVVLTHPRTGAPIQVILNGKMDIIVRDVRQDWIVLDLKHTRDEGYWRKTVGQLSFYDLAVELLYGRPTRLTALLQPLCKEKFKPYAPSAESRIQLLTRIHAMAVDITDGIKDVRPDTKLCGWCPTKHACEKFLPVIDKRGRKKVAF